jgi:hypothetical protein
MLDQAAIRTPKTFREKIHQTVLLDLVALMFIGVYVAEGWQGILCAILFLVFLGILGMIWQG